MQDFSVPLHSCSRWKQCSSANAFYSNNAFLKMKIVPKGNDSSDLMCCFVLLLWCLDNENYEFKRLGFAFMLCEILFSSSRSGSDILWELWGWELRKRLPEWFWPFVRNVRPGETDRPTACIHARAISPATLPLENEVIVARCRKNNNYHLRAFCQWNE